MRRAVVVGDVIDDILVRPDSPTRPDTDTAARIAVRPGGSAANAACWLASAGFEVDFVGRVGAADVTRHAAEFARQRVRDHLVADTTEPTGSIVLLVDGDVRTMFTDRGANRALDGGAVPDALLAGADLLHLTAYTLFGHDGDAGFPDLIARARCAGARVSIDPSSAGFLVEHGAERALAAFAGADVLLPNLEEGRVLTGETEPEAVARALAALFPLVVLTLGREGCLVATPGGIRRVAATGAAAVDATGAGDAFAAGFLAAWVGGAAPEDAAAAGARVGAHAVTLVGGRPVPRFPPLVLMGVSGCGKTTIGIRLAERLGTSFVDGDDLHPAANVAKMAEGHPLDDADRAPWLDSVGQVLAAGAAGAVACSALRRRYRDALRKRAPESVFVFLDADEDVLRARVRNRSHAFMPASLLDSQLATLERPAEEERTVVVDPVLPLDEVVERIVAGVRALSV